MTQRQLDVVELLAPAARTASANGTGADLQGYVNPGGSEMKAFLSVGAASGTTPTLDVKLQDSDDDSTYADISGAAFAQKTATGSEAIHFQTKKRYVRAVATIAGTTPSFTFAVIAIAESRVSP